MNYIGQQFGCYIIEKESENKSSDGHKQYIGKCVYCDTLMESRINQFEKRLTNSCSHFVFGVPIVKWSNKRIQSIFNNMIHRCYNKKYKDYKYYGAKGIEICKKWFNNPILFEKWSLENNYEEELTIDRIDSTKNYSPKNCRWITLEENSRFKSTTNYIEVNGILKSGRQWSEYLGKGINYINRQIRNHGLGKTKKHIKSLLEN